MTLQENIGLRPMRTIGPKDAVNSKQLRKYEWKVTRELFKSLCQLMMEMVYAKTIIELPNLRIKPTGEYSVRTALSEREQFSRRKTDYFRNEKKQDPIVFT